MCFISSPKTTCVDMPLFISRASEIMPYRSFIDSEIIIYHLQCIMHKQFELYFVVFSMRFCACVVSNIPSVFRFLDKLPYIESSKKGIFGEVSMQHANSNACTSE